LDRAFDDVLNLATKGNPACLSELPHRRTKHYFQQLVLATDQQGAVADARAQLAKRSPNAHVVHAAATRRPDSRDAEAAILAGWKLRDNWWTRPIRAGDDLAAIAAHGYANSRRINTRTTAGCVAIDRSAGRASQ
jgi:hypothetical protein